MRQQHDAVRSHDADLAERLTAIAVKASTAILAVDFRKAGTRHKSDNSPVTQADEAAQAVILGELARVAADIPVVSEEAVCDWQGKAPPEFLLVDPLDGTSEFLAGRLEYTVNIALVRGGVPVVGVVAAPALGLLWRGVTGHGAARLRFSPGDAAGRIRKAEPIHTRPWPADKPVAAVSRSHFDPTSAAFLERLGREGLGAVTPLACGSALKFCRLAEGAIDVYPRLAPTFEWDVAAGHAVVAAAGGTVVAMDGAALTFGHVDRGFHVPGFIAWGDPKAALPTR